MGAELTRPGGAGTLVLAGNVSRPPRGTRLGRLKTLGIQHRPVVRHCPGKRVRSVAAPRPPPAASRMTAEESLTFRRMSGRVLSLGAGSCRTGSAPPTKNLQGTSRRRSYTSRPNSGQRLSMHSLVRVLSPPNQLPDRAKRFGVPGLSGRASRTAPH